MSDFVRFPRTPHLRWLGSDRPRDDKVLSSAEARAFLSGIVTVEEKLDGANIGISATENGVLRVQSRGSYLSLESRHPQFKPLRHWLTVHQPRLPEALGSNLILFGEWCYARHTISYDRLPDWLLAFDIFDRKAARFLSVKRRDTFCAGLGLSIVPRIKTGCFDLRSIDSLLGDSRFGDGPAEGVYLRRDQGDCLEARAKLVRPEFAQAIGEHWQRRRLTPNRIAGSAAMMR